MYEQYSPAIFGVIKRIIPDNNIAEEILQQSFLKAWNKFNSYDENKSGLYTWLSSIARNTAIDKVRLKGYQNNLKSKSYESTVHDNRSSETDLSGLDTNNLLKNLEEKYRVILDMMYLQGYSQSEISDKLDLPLGTVKTRLRKAIQILREELKNEKSLFLGAFFILVLAFLLCQ